MELQSQALFVSPIACCTQLYSTILTIHSALQWLGNPHYLRHSGAACDLLEGIFPSLDLLPRNKLTLQTLFTGSILYTGCIACIKLSILTLYRRLFPTKTMNIAVQIVGGIVILWAVCGILAGCFNCIPTEKLWYPDLPGGCMNLPKFYYGLQIPNIVTDAIILVMPMQVVWGLPISRAQKVGLSGIFVVGLLYVHPASV